MQVALAHLASMFPLPTWNMWNHHSTINSWMPVTSNSKPQAGRRSRSKPLNGRCLVLYQRMHEGSCRVLGGAKAEHLKGTTPHPSCITPHRRRHETARSFVGSGTKHRAGSTWRCGGSFAAPDQDRGQLSCSVGCGS